MAILDVTIITQLLHSCGVTEGQLPNVCIQLILIRMELNMKKIYAKSCYGLLLMLFISTPMISQAQIDVDVDINVDEITILYAFSDIDVTIDTAALGTVLTDGTCVAGTNSLECDEGDALGPVVAVDNAGTLEATFDIATALSAIDPSSVDLLLENVWAVRAIGGTTANTTVTAALGAANVLNNGASAITVNTATAAPGTFADPGLGAPQVGDVTLNLDFTGVTLAGNHDDGNDTGDVVYTLEVTAN